MQGSVESGAQKLLTSSNEEHTYYVLLRGSATVGNTLTANVFNECGQSPEKEAAYSWQQKVDGAWTNIAGETSARIRIPTGLLGSQIRALAVVSTTEGLNNFTSKGVRVDSQNSIVIENLNAGTTDWKITNLATNHEIEAYADATSINAGDSLNIKVSLSSAGQYNLEVYRLGYYGGAGGRLIASALGLDGLTQSSPTMTNPDTRLIECLWDVSYELKTSAAWTSGLYVIKLTDCRSGKQSLVPFVLRKDNHPSDIGFQDAVTTAQAYNIFGGFSVYDANSASNTRAYQVSFDRPYDATHLGFSNTDGFNCNNMLTWEYNMVRWLESQGYDISYYANVDVHSNPLQILSHRIFLSVGHDEYWSMEQRNRVELARDNGINLAFYSANTAYWQVRFDCSSRGQSNRVVTIYKDSSGIGAGLSLDPVAQLDPPASTSVFRSNEVNRPENALIGVGYVSDHGSIYEGFDFIVSNAADPIYAHTGLRNGDRLKGLVGYEWDAVLDNEESPSGLVILSKSSTRANEILPPLPGGTRPNISHAVYYRAVSGARVFSTGSIQWVWGLDNSWAFQPPQLTRSWRRRIKNWIKGLVSLVVTVPIRNMPCVDSRAQQMTVNLFSEMDVRPQTPSSWLTLS
ncbi:N,N-dimethylformamidase beta subunit family domain-containing protein [Rhizobium leguminosarum]|uniref:N,N-dimethylformamidase beta subunit family domain-containing protein n=1 Tax=Rhizobium leguminosarum TaxID=384 RepID=UPI003F9CB33F